MPVSLQNLLKIGQLKDHPPDAAELQRLLAAADRLLPDVTAWLKVHRPQLMVPQR
jgi:hypothetical protein